jgi:hypothetical protein
VALTSARAEADSALTLMAQDLQAELEKLAQEKDELLKTELSTLLSAKEAEVRFFRTLLTFLKRVLAHTMWQCNARL